MNQFFGTRSGGEGIIRLRGAAEPGESIAEACEAAGCRLQSSRYARHLHGWEKIKVVAFHFEGEVVGGQAGLSNETSDLRNGFWILMRITGKQ